MALNVLSSVDFSCTFKPSLREFDLGAVLYHANYFHLYEKTREAFLKEAGLPYPKLVEDGFHLAVSESGQEFIKPIYYGQEVKVILSVQEISRATVIFYYEILDAKSEELLHEAWTKQVFVEKTVKGFKPRKLPEVIVRACEALMG